MSGAHYTVRFRWPNDPKDCERVFVSEAATTPVEAIAELVATDHDHHLHGGRWQPIIHMTTCPPDFPA
jgi:hypothetical protein